MLDLWLQEIETDPVLRHTLIYNLRHWHTNTIPSLNRSELESEQDKVGWDFVLEGTFVSTWSTYQQCHLQLLGKKSSGRRWLTLLIKKLLDIAWDLWEHRNSIEHHNDTELLDRKLTAAVETEILRGFAELPLYRYGTLFTSHELQKVRLATTEYKRCWVNHIAQAREQVARAHTDPVQTQMRQLMRTFLGLPH
jgi:hypothetical protein